MKSRESLSWSKSFRWEGCFCVQHKLISCAKTTWPDPKFPCLPVIVSEPSCSSWRTRCWVAVGSQDAVSFDITLITARAPRACWHQGHFWHHWELSCHSYWAALPCLVESRWVWAGVCLGVAASLHASALCWSSADVIGGDHISLCFDKRLTAQPVCMCGSFPLLCARLSSTSYKGEKMGWWEVPNVEEHGC